MSKPLTINIENSVAVVTLNRPDKHNAIDLEMIAALSDAGVMLMTRRWKSKNNGCKFCRRASTSKLMR